MKGGVFLLEYVVTGTVQSGISIKNAIIYCFCNPGQLLIYYAAGTYVQMAHFGIAHLTFRKAYGKTACIKLYIRIFFKNTVKIGGSCSLDGIAVFRRVQSETVEYHQHGRSFVYFIHLIRLSHLSTSYIICVCLVYFKIILPT